LLMRLFTEGPTRQAGSCEVHNTAESEDPSVNVHKNAKLTPSG